MDNHFQSCYSNRTEILYLHLKQRLFTSSSPLAKRIILVPSPAMKSWLTLQLANDPDLGIAAGIEIGQVEPSMKKIIQAVSSSSSNNTFFDPSELELSLAIEAAILDICTLPRQKTNEWLPLLHYLGIDALKSKHLPKKILRRISSLSSAMAKQFIDYGIYGANMISDWNSKEQHEWQPLLWLKMEKLFNTWNYPARKLADIPIKDALNPSMLQIHLFGLSYFPPLYTRFLHSIAKHIPVTYYLLSPCQKFWGDILSNKEGLKLKNYWKQKDATPSTQEALDNLIRDNNPLLANLGKLGRVMSNQMEEYNNETSEQYSLPESILQHPQYTELATDEIILESRTNPLSLLEAIQSDMALLRNPEANDPICFDSYDSSIQIHAAPKKIREVEAIHNLLLSIIDKHANDSNPITPGDILVMTPNISSYLPFIHSVFNSQAASLDIQLMEPQAATRHEPVRAFLHLLSLARSRWEATSFVQLFEFPSFRRKLNLDLEDVNIIHGWIKEAKIHWGTDDSHRAELMQRDYLANTIHEESPKGTWEHGLGSLIESLVLKKENTAKGIDFSKADLLGSVLHIIRSLKEDFRPLTNGSKLSLEEWSSYLSCILEAYLSPYDGEGSSDGFQALSDHINTFCKCSDRLKDNLFTFDSIHKHLEEQLQKESSSYRESNLNAVRFSSLLPMRTVPAKVVVLMGMGDGEFPRLGQHKTWNLLHNNPTADYYPETVDFDRYLFLESLLSARKYLLFSYVSQEPGNTKELSPSVLVKEILNYIDAAYSIKDSKPSLHCCFKHPLDPFDAKYFTESGTIQNYSQIHFKAATAHYKQQKSPRHSFIESYIPAGTTQDKPKTHKFELATLVSYAKDPFKSFLNSQGLYLDKAEDRQFDDDAELFLNHLDKWIIIREALTNSIDEALILAENTGMLPPGSFNPVSKEKLKKEVEEVHNTLKKLDPNCTDIFPIIFNEKQTTPVQTEHGWLLPPISLNSPETGPIKIVGKINLVTAQGLLLLEKHDLENSIEAWPSILAFSCLIKQFDLPVNNQVIFLKGSTYKLKSSDFPNPDLLLARFVDYFQNTRDTPSPLDPELVQLLLNDKMEQIQSSQYAEEQQSSNFGFKSPYTGWKENNSANPDRVTHCDHWNSKAKHLYGALHDSWFTKKSSGDNHEDV